MKVLYVAILFFLAGSLFAQAPDSPLFDDDPMQHLPVGMEYSKYRIRQPTGAAEVTARVEPPNWWADMVNPRLEIMVHEKNVGRYASVTTDYPGVTVEYVKSVENPNYLFIGLHLAPGTEVGEVPLTFHSSLRSSAGTGGRAENGRMPAKTLRYPIYHHPRETHWQDREALSSKDLIYLIMPDRFANGDPTNDRVYGTNDTIVARQKLLFRHGGDLRGIIDHLDYLDELGVTALWLNPILENDQPYASYHGYAVTDHYRIDPRLGTNQDYAELVEAAHEKGIKVIMDVIFNHVGDEHSFIRDLPSTDWIHQWPEYTQTTYRATTLLDPNASEYDRKLMSDGWFDKHMPDLNQHNEHLANFLIQNSIWWTIVSDQDAFRIDTYSYPDLDFMAEWNRRVKAEIPHIGIYGETWVHGPGVQAWFVGGQHINQRLDTELPGVTDFQVYYALHEALSEDPSWTGGVMRLHYTLAQDYLYEDPNKNVTFLDNHDIARIMTTFNGDMVKMKSALGLLLTLRGIPMLYYGTELGLEGAGGAFGEGGRIDFPGGFAGDERNLFTENDRTETQRELFDYVKFLGRYRRSSEALTTGEFRQFVPRDGVYVFFRRAGRENIMVVFNGNSKEMTLSDLTPYQEMLGGQTRAVDLTNKGASRSLDSLQLAPKETVILRLK